MSNKYEPREDFILRDGKTCRPAQSENLQKRRTCEPMSQRGTFRQGLRLRSGGAPHGSSKAESRVTTRLSEPFQSLRGGDCRHACWRRRYRHCDCRTEEHKWVSWNGTRRCAVLMPAQFSVAPATHQRVSMCSVTGQVTTPTGSRRLFRALRLWMRRREITGPDTTPCNPTISGPPRPVGAAGARRPHIASPA